MNETARQALDLLQANPHAVAAIPDRIRSKPAMHLHMDFNTQANHFATPKTCQDLQVIPHQSPGFRILRLENPDESPEALNPLCFNEPIPLGCQIQPEGANWVGTAGAPIKWIDARNEPHWGILSNWHVMADGREELGRPIHQPTSQSPICARLENWNPISTDDPNVIDAALADSLIDDYHTTSFDILEIGHINPAYMSAHQGLDVLKHGRTTDLTPGVCIGTNAAVRVGYGDFTAEFVDQDIYQGMDGPFSAPGDSGSLIVCAAKKRPTSLLFAGNDEMTIGNPVRYLIGRFQLEFAP